MSIDLLNIVLNVDLKTSDLLWVYFVNSTQNIQYTLGYFALIFLALIVIAPGYFGDLVSSFPRFGLIIFVIAVYYALLNPYLVARRFAKAMGARGPQRYTFSELGIDVTAKHFSAHYDWPAFQKVKQTSSLVMLYTRERSGLVLPKRCFESENQLSAIRKLLANKIRKDKQ